MTILPSDILITFGFIILYFFIRAWMDVHFSYKIRRLDYGHFFCMGVIHGADYNEAHTGAAIDYSHKYQDFVRDMKSERVRKDFLDFIEMEYKTYYLVSRARLPESDPLHIDRTVIPNYEYYFPR